MKKLISWFSDTDVRNILAIMIVTGCFSAIYFLIIKPVPEINKDIVIAAIGYVLAKIGDVTGYYFGSSKKQDDEGKQP